MNSDPQQRVTPEQESHTAGLPAAATFLSNLALRLLTASPDSQDASLGKTAEREQVEPSFDYNSTELG